MTSLASYLASLAGAAPQGGQSTTPASGTGASGLFAALLETTSVPTDASEGIPHQTDPTGLLPTTPNPNAAPGEPQVAAGDTFLGKALSEGLNTPGEDGEVEAEIIEGPLDATAAGELPGETGVPANTVDSEDAVPAPAPPTTTGTDTAAPAAAAAPDTNVTSVASGAPAPRPDVQGRTPDRLLQQQASRNQTQDGAPSRPTGLEAAVQHASDNGLENGLAKVPARTGNGPGTGAVAHSQNTPLSGSDGEATIEKPAQIDGKRPEIAPDKGRPEFAPRPPQIIQRLIKTDTGQSLIQVQERIGGDSTGISSPPTLTVSVQAPAASPGPASPPAPHVPVGALAVHIAHQANNGAKRFEIRLDPPELGRIDVRLDVSREGQVMTHLVVERAETLDLLLRDAKQLERALQDAGLDTSDKGMKFSLKDQSLSGDDKGFFDDDDVAHGARGDEGDDGSADPDMPPPQRYIASTGLDIRI